MVCKKRVANNFWDRNSILFAQAEYPSEKIINMFIAVLFLEVDRQLKTIFAFFLNLSLYLKALKWKISKQNKMEDNSHWPNIDSLTIRLMVQYLRCHEFLCSTQSFSTWLTYRPGKTKISNFENWPIDIIRIPINQNILRFDISMNELPIMHCFESFEDIWNDL